MFCVVAMTDLLHVFWHPGMLLHDPGIGVFDTLHDPGFLEVLDRHPENADRVRNMVSVLQKGPISPYLVWHHGRRAQISELLSFHTANYVQELRDADAQGGRVFCEGTKLGPESWDAALLAAGSTLEAMQSIIDGQNRLAYALVRPPGHHAQPSQADGYCFLNNAGLAVQLAIDSGVSRVAVVDIDVHYGNDTADGFYSRDDVFTISLHMNHGSWGPSHPQSGLPNEVGRGRGVGFNMNVPLPNGAGDRGYEHAMLELIVPALSKFKPEIFVMVIGQDSSAFDPNGRQCLTMMGYRRLGQILREQAELYSDGRILLVQEGGYHLTYAAYCLHATLEGILSISYPLLSDPIAYYPEDEKVTIAAVSQIKKDWGKSCLNAMPK